MPRSVSPARVGRRLANCCEHLCNLLGTFVSRDGDRETRSPVQIKKGDLVALSYDSAILRRPQCAALLCGLEDSIHRTPANLQAVRNLGRGDAFAM
jgi:hypothetical protein